VAQAAGALDCPGPPRPGRRPGQQAFRLDSAGADPQLTQRLLHRADRHCRVRGLLRIDPDHHCRHGNTPSLPAGKDRGGHAQFQDLCGAHASFEPRHGEARQAGTSFESQPQQGGRRKKSQANRDLSTLRPDSLPSRPGPHRLPKSQLGGSVRGYTKAHVALRDGLPHQPASSAGVVHGARLTRVAWPTSLPCQRCSTLSAACAGIARAGQVRTFMQRWVAHHRVGTGYATSSGRAGSRSVCRQR
jgi:hypothetical protein